MIEHRLFDDIGGTQTEWLNAKHHFAIGHFGKPTHRPVGVLYVRNDDELAPRDDHGRPNDPEKTFRSWNWATRGGPLVNGKRHFAAARDRYHHVSLTYAAQTFLAPELPSFLLDQCNRPMQVRIFVESRCA